MFYFINQKKEVKEIGREIDMLVLNVQKAIKKKTIIF